jgi:hypothetical protein
MTLKDIAVAVDPTSECDGRLHLAACLARRHEAHLTGFYVVRDLRSRYSFVRGHPAIRSAIGNCSHSRQRDAVRNGRHFTCIARQHNVQADFRAIWRDADIGYRSLFADIMIIGNWTRPDLPNSWPLERLLFAEGVPLMLVPTGVEATTIAQRIVIAWNASKEARRATASAIPLLANAHSVTLITLGEINGEADVDIALHLARHGVRTKSNTSLREGSPWLKSSRPKWLGKMRIWLSWAPMVTLGRRECSSVG